ncbi:hypothetical protein ACFFX1_33665 [Dactylosporangium sucinum]|uniref:Uncharacterized protein n=1 Tax=Dactylosporangium sucinum TaxID=1424081 RepID=A0A917TR58_9ACTN|nr:hypothetical protein [Dactylosporangium sucinum]GGM33064.1 hypothetical protein GCM10007977_038050 [Dactylosporangium sucinum]
MVTVIPKGTSEIPAATGQRGMWIAGGIALAWLLPLATHAVHLDVLLPFVVLAGTMAVQRGCVGLFDRFVVSCAQLFGAACLFGLAITYWPGHLHPTLVAGVALTVLVLVAAATKRLTKPPKPRVERLLALAAAGVSAVTLVPYVARDLGGRLGLPLAGEDITRHFLLYDVIGRIGGYPFLRPEALRPFVPDEEWQGIANYPQGLHFAYAVLDRFVRSSGHNGAPATSVDVLVWLLVGTFLLLALAVLWAARRIAGPGASPARLLPVLFVIAAWLVLGDPVTVLSRGYPNEMAGLACAVVLTGLVARPLTRGGEQLVTVALLLVGVSFSYPLFLPYAGIVAAWWAWRARLWRHWWAWLVAIVTLAVAAIGPLTAAAASTGEQLLLNGTARVVDRPATLALAVLATLGLLANRRAPSQRAALFAVGVALAMAAGLGLYQIATIGRPVYYFDKLLHLLIVVGLAGLGGLARVLPRRGLPLRAAVAFPVVLAMAVAGGKWHATPVAPGVKLALGKDRGSPEAARDALLMARMYPDGGNAINVDLMGNPWRNWSATLGASTLQRQYRHVPGWSRLLYPGGKGGTYADLERLVVDSPVTVRFFVHDPEASMLVVDVEHPNRPAVRAGQPLPVAFGDPLAPSNIEAARLLAAKYPTKVQVVYATPANP